MADDDNTSAFKPNPGIVALSAQMHGRPIEAPSPPGVAPLASLVTVPSATSQQRGSNYLLLADLVAEIYRKIYPCMSEDNYEELRTYITSPPEKEKDRTRRAHKISRDIVYTDFLSRKSNSRPLATDFTLNDELLALVKECAENTAKVLGVTKVIRNAPTEAELLTKQITLLPHHQSLKSAAEALVGWQQEATDIRKLENGNGR